MKYKRQSFSNHKIEQWKYPILRTERKYFRLQKNMNGASSTYGTTFIPKPIILEIRILGEVGQNEVEKKIMNV